MINKETSRPVDQKAEMITLLNLWKRWYRLRRAATWSVHGLAIGLALGLLVSLAAVYRGLLLRDEFLTLIFLISAGGLILGASTGFAWRSSRLRAAQFFDLQFGLQERISTALEWAEGPDLDRERETLLSKQFTDALAAARRVDVRVRLPVRIAWQEILIALIFAVSAVLLSYWGRPLFQAVQEKRAIQQAIAGEAAKVEAILDEIQTSSKLTPEQREALAAPLEDARRQLQEAQTLEQSVSILTRAEGELSSLSDPGAQAQEQALREVGQDWSQAQEDALRQTGEQLADGDTGAAAQTLKDLDLSQAGQFEREALARQLEEAGRSLAQTNPDLAEQLDAAAANLRAGDAQAAQQDLQDAARQLSEAGEGMEGSAQAVQAAAEVGAARQRLLQQAGGGSPLTGEANTAGDGESTGSGQVGSTAGQGSANGQQSGSSNGGGAGRGEGAVEPGSGGPAGAGPIDQGNLPGDGGEQVYEPIVPPQQLGGSGGEVITLPGGDGSGDLVTGQGDLPFDQPGQSQVPYTEVYPQYAETYRQAIESGQVPLQLRPVVRDYFSSLEPLP